MQAHRPLPHHSHPQSFLRKLLTEDLPQLMVLPKRLEINIPPSVTSVAEVAVGRDTIMRAVASAVLQVRLGGVRVRGGLCLCRVGSVWQCCRCGMWICPLGSGVGLRDGGAQGAVRLPWDVLVPGRVWPLVHPTRPPLPMQADAVEQALLSALPLGPQTPAGGVTLPEFFKVGVGRGKSWLLLFPSEFRGLGISWLGAAPDASTALSLHPNRASWMWCSGRRGTCRCGASPARATPTAA